jgi:hypothetical protein
MAFVAVAQMVGALIQQGFDTEYRPKRRGKLVASAIPLLAQGLRKQTEAYAKAVQRGNMTNANRIMFTRKMHAPAIMLFGLPVEVHAESDDSLAIEAYSKTASSSGKTQGNIVATQGLAQTLMVEVVYFASTPRMVVLNTDPNEGWGVAKAACLAEIDRLMRHPDQLALIYPLDRDAKNGRMPLELRQHMLAFYTEAYGANLLPGNFPLPNWVLGYSMADEKPGVAVTLETYTALLGAIQTNQITSASLTAMGA